MALPITKKASSSCVKNAAEVNDSMQDMLVGGAAAVAPKFNDIGTTVKENLDSESGAKQTRGGQGSKGGSGLTKGQKFVQKVAGVFAGNFLSGVEEANMEAAQRLAEKKKKEQEDKK